MEFILVIIYNMIALLDKPISRDGGSELFGEAGEEINGNSVSPFLEGLEKVLTTTSCYDFCLGLAAAPELL